MDLVSPQPFWPLKNGLLSVYPSLKSDVNCDVVVLGGGISGAFAAEALASVGFNVIVLDKRDAAAEARVPAPRFFSMKSTHRSLHWPRGMGVSI